MGGNARRPTPSQTQSRPAGSLTHPTLKKEAPALGARGLVEPGLRVPYGEPCGDEGKSATPSIKNAAVAQFNDAFG